VEHSKQMSQYVVDDTQRTNKYNMRPLSKHYEFTKCSSKLRVKDNTKYPHKSYCRNRLAVFYSYDNKSCVHAKHMVITIKFML
jgi:hypothetical protein